MLLLVLIFNLLVLVSIVYNWQVRAKLYTSIIQTTLLAVIIWAIWLVTLTEILSLIHHITTYSVFAGWSIFSLSLIAYNYLSPPPALKGYWYNRLLYEPIVIPILFIIFISGLIAIVSPPNNWDSMTYHLSRVMHWIQNQSLHHYATHELRQLYQNPFAEMVILHVIILKGDDQFVNVVQWLSMLGSVCAAYYVTQQLKRSFNAAIMASFITITLPMGILQSVTTQNDYVFSFWVICFVSFILAIQDNTHWLNRVGLAGSLALAVLTKGTSYILLPPFFIWSVIILLKQNLQQTILTVTLMTVVTLGLNLGHYQRNYQIFNSPIKPAVNPYSNEDYANESMSPSLLISNIARNLTLHLHTPSIIINESLQYGLIRLHEILQIDINNPKTTWKPTPFTVAKLNVHEDESGNFIHLLLCFLTMVWVIRKRNPIYIYYTLCIITSFVLFTFTLKWQPWHSRLHLPLFILFAPLIALWFTEIQVKRLKIFIVALLVIQASPFLLINPAHPIVAKQNIFNKTRLEQYFIPKPHIQRTYLEIVQATQPCTQVGLVASYDTWEYPLWVLSPPRPPIHLESIEVNNMTQILTHQDFKPCAVICLSCSLEQNKQFTDKYPQKLVLTPYEDKTIIVFKN